MNRMMGLIRKSVTLISPLLMNSVSLSMGRYFHLGFFESANATPTASQIHFSAPQFNSLSGQPGGRGRGAGGRGPCKQDESLAALVPTTKTATKEFVRVLTTVEHPTFWFYLPSQATETSIEFVQGDDRDGDPGSGSG